MLRRVWKASELSYFGDFFLDNACCVYADIFSFSFFQKAGSGSFEFILINYLRGLTKIVITQRPS